MSAAPPAIPTDTSQRNQAEASTKFKLGDRGGGGDEGQAKGPLNPEISATFTVAPAVLYSPSYPAAIASVARPGRLRRR